MTRQEFGNAFELLESAFGQQGAERRQFYFRQLEHIPVWVFDRAVRRVIEVRDDRYGFPLVAELHTSIDEVQKGSEDSGVDFDSAGYCQKCGNSGLYMNAQNGATPCACRAGRLKAVRLRLSLTARQSEVEERVRTLPPPEPPFRGLQEKNPLGFWESTQEEHDTWMAVKGVEVAAIKERMAGMPERRAMLDDDLRRKLLKDIVAGLRPRKANLIMTDYKARATGEREPGDDDAPF